MAPNTSTLKNRSTVIESKYLSRSSKSKAKSCSENIEQSTKVSNQIPQQLGDIRKDNAVKKTLTKSKKRSGFSLFKPFGCGQCRMRFIQMDQLQKHVRFHNQEKNLMSSQKSTSATTQDESIRSISCSFPGCDKMLKTRKALRNHIRKDHPLV